MAAKHLMPEIAKNALRCGQACFIYFDKQLPVDPDFANEILNDTLEGIAHCSSCRQRRYDIRHSSLYAS